MIVSCGVMLNNMNDDSLVGLQESLQQFKGPLVA